MLRFYANVEPNRNASNFIDEEITPIYVITVSPLQVKLLTCAALPLTASTVWKNVRKEKEKKKILFCLDDPKRR